MSNKQEKRMIETVGRLQEYIATYHQQAGFEKYSDKTFIDDVLYLLGIALDEKKYYAATGYDEFKKVLIKHLEAA